MAVCVYFLPLTNMRHLTLTTHHGDIEVLLLLHPSFLDTITTGFAPKDYKN